MDIHHVAKIDPSCTGFYIKSMGQGNILGNLVQYNAIQCIEGTETRLLKVGKQALLKRNFMHFSAW
jgi:hypothetical protein